jgi:hypothetical protein
MQVNCYFFEAGRVIAECGFSFKKNTYIYGEQIAFVDRQALQSIYKKEKKDYRVVCNLSATEFQSIKECLKSAGVVKNKFKKLL